MRTDPSYRIAIPSSSVKHFASLARRLSRIFAHAYFHHREIFEQAEAENALYERYIPPLLSPKGPPQTSPLIENDSLTDFEQIPWTSTGVQPCSI